MKKFFTQLFCLHDYKFMTSVVSFFPNGVSHIERWHKCTKCNKLRSL